MPLKFVVVMFAESMYRRYCFWIGMRRLCNLYPMFDSVFVRGQIIKLETLSFAYRIFFFDKVYAVQKNVCISGTRTKYT